MPERLPYVVEPMALSDVDQVMAIERMVFPAPWSARAYRYEITENDHSTMLVIRSAATAAGPLGHLGRRLGVIAPPPILGYAGFWLLVDEAHICTIAVHPQRQGQGLGELLLLSLLDQSIKLGAHVATLEVRVSNHTALTLYHKYGFEIISRRKRYYTDNNEDAYIMTTAPLGTARAQTNLDNCRRFLYDRLAGRQAGSTARDPGPGLTPGGPTIPTHEQRAG